MTEVESHLTSSQRGSIIRSLYAVVALGEAAVFLYLTIMPYTCKLYGIDNRTYGYIQSAASFFQMCSSPLTGRIADMFGAKTVLLMNAVSCASAHLLLGLSRGSTLFILSRLATVFHAIVPGAQMLLTNIVDKSERAEYLGKVMIPSSLGIVFGPLLGSALSKIIGQQNSLLVSWLLPVIAGIIVIIKVPVVKVQPIEVKEDKLSTSRGGIKRLLELCTMSKVPVYLITRIFLAVPAMILDMSFPLVAMETFGLEAHQNALIVSYCGLLGIFVNGYLAGRASKSFSSGTLIKFSAILAVFTYACMSHCADVLSLCLVLIPWMVSTLLIENQLITAATKCVPESDTGTIVGVSMGAFHLARMVAPLIGSVLVETTGFPGFGYVGLVCALFASALCFLTL